MPVSNKHMLSVSKQLSVLNVCHMKVTRATNIPKHVLEKCRWAKSVRGVPALCKEGTNLSPLFFHCLIFFSFVFQGFLCMSKWYVFYIESNQSPWMLATDCVFWCSILWKTFIVSLTIQYLVFFTTRYQQYEKILNSKTSVNKL